MSKSTVPEFLKDMPLSSGVVTKETNPKDAIGSGKLPINLVPPVGEMYASLAFLEGALKYGRYNWRIAGVRMSIYFDALHRHLAKYWDGEDVDPETQVPHLSSALACIIIILDAKHAGKLTDDRPPVVAMGATIAELTGVVALLKEQFKDRHPKQYTIADSEGPRD